jgi:hypothetical protein
MLHPLASSLEIIPFGPEDLTCKRSFPGRNNILKYSPDNFFLTISKL